MPFVLPMTDQEAENARLLDRLTKQQEINQSLRAENAGLKADFAGWKASYDDDIREARAEGIEKLNSDLAMKDTIILGLREAKYQLSIKHDAEIEKLKRQQCDTEYEMTYYKDYIMGAPNGWEEFAEELSRGIKGTDIDINWSWLKDDFNLFSVVYYYMDPITEEPIETKTTMIRDVNEIDDIDNPTPEELEAHKEFFSECVLGATIKSMELIKVYDFSDSPREPTEVEKLKAELISVKAKHHRDTQKTCLKAKFDTWRGEQAGYTIEDEAFWLVGEAINIQDAIEVFNELYEDGCCGDESTWQLKCDKDRKWELEQWWMDEEGEYTLTEAEFEAQNQEDTCDFCDKQRQVLTKRDAGYDEWTCSTCHKEQYPEQYEEKQ